MMNKREAGQLERTVGEMKTSGRVNPTQASEMLAVYRLGVIKTFLYVPYILGGNLFIFKIPPNQDFLRDFRVIYREWSATPRKLGEPCP